MTVVCISGTDFKLIQELYIISSDLAYRLSKYVNHGLMEVFLLLGFDNDKRTARTTYSLLINPPPHNANLVQIKDY